MSILLSTPEQFLADLNQAEPIDRPRFNQLYAAIGRAVSQNCQANDDEIEGTFKVLENEDLNIIGRTRVGRTSNASEYSLATFYEGHPIFIDFGVIAVASIFDPSFPDSDITDSFLLSTTVAAKRYITSEQTGRSIDSELLEDLIKEICCLVPFDRQR